VVRAAETLSCEPAGTDAGRFRHRFVSHEIPRADVVTMGSGKRADRPSWSRSWRHRRGRGCRQPRGSSIDRPGDEDRIGGDDGVVPLRLRPAMTAITNRQLRRVRPSG
jgi:hypothetical protein